jgi:hypothetical protein
LKDTYIRIKKSAEVIVVAEKSRTRERKRSGGELTCDEGLNVRLSRIRQGGLISEFAGLVLNKGKGFIGKKSD